VEITKDEWTDWKTHPVTKAFFEAIQYRIDDAKEDLSRSAGLEPDNDNWYRGFCHAYREALEFDIEFSEEESK